MVLQPLSTRLIKANFYVSKSLITVRVITAIAKDDRKRETHVCKHRRRRFARRASPLKEKGIFQVKICYNFAYIVNVTVSYPESTKE